VPDDCRNGCTYPTTLSVGASRLVARLQLPPSFSISFDVAFPALAADVKILEIADLAGNNLLSLLSTSTRATKVLYNAQTLTTSSVPFVSAYNTTYTNFKLEVLSTAVRVTSSSDPGTSPAYSIPGVVDTAGNIYALSLQASATGGAGGTFRNIVISGTK
jgi:hypothetical protein